jgi:hypothetical protein
VRLKNNTKSTGGRNLENLNLAEALTHMTELTGHEWKDLNIKNLAVPDFVKSGENYFKPCGSFLDSTRATWPMGYRRRDAA